MILAGQSKDFEIQETLTSVLQNEMSHPTDKEEEKFQAEKTAHTMAERRRLASCFAESF